MESDKRLSGPAAEPFVSILAEFAEWKHIIVDSFRGACYNTPAFEKNIAFSARRVLLMTLRHVIGYRIENTNQEEIICWTFNI